MSAKQIEGSLGSKSKSKRVTATLNGDEHAQLVYWAARKEMTINEFILYAIQLAIRHENGDYELPMLEQQRLNQILDMITVLSSNAQSLEQIVISGFDSLLGLTRGDNYLIENEDGDI